MKSYITRIALCFMLSTSVTHAGLYELLEPFMSDFNKQNWQRDFGVTPHKAPEIFVCTFDDVAGTVPADILDLVEQIKDADKFREFGINPPKGILLVGPPGTGKTLIARAVAGEVQAGFFNASGSEFIEMFVGVGAKRVRDLFAKANAYTRAHPGQKAIVFIDEIDAIGGSRNGFSHAELRQTLNELLNQMDGYKTNPNIIVIAATNTVDMLDPALKRAGRFDIHIEIPLPDTYTRQAVLQHYINKLPAHKIGNINTTQLAQHTRGCNNADLKGLVNYAAKIALREQAPKLTQKHFEHAAQKIIEQKRH